MIHPTLIITIIDMKSSQPTTTLRSRLCMLPTKLPPPCLLPEAESRSLSWKARKRDNPSMEGRRKAPGKRRLSRKKRYFALFFLLLLLAMSGGALFTYAQFNATYHRYLALAASGAQHLSSA